MMDAEKASPVGTGGLGVRGRSIITGAELASLRAAVGGELLASATLRAWLAGEERLTPHSVAVALETQLRMLFGEPAETCALLVTVLDRLAEEFPAEVQPLETTSTGEPVSVPAAHAPRTHGVNER